MSLGLIMLCHTAFDRAGQVARHWAAHGCPLVIHIDRRVPDAEAEAFRRSLADVADVRFAPRHPCEWGTFGIVAATLDAAALMLRDFPGVRHVMLVSGSCLPLRPVADLMAYLDAHPGTDFIESVTTEDVGWTIGGLDIERFTLRFPFSWRSRRALFDAYVRLQRRVGWSRRIPRGIKPHLGSQWWCLTRATLRAILGDPDRAARDRYFRKVWIPDEAYFQTLVRQHSKRIESRSLTLSKFDVHGRPHIFYDDHLQLLRRSDCFIARKIWPRADKLYQAFLAADETGTVRGEPSPGKIDRLFSKAAERRIRGRRGLVMQSRYPADPAEAARTAAPYSVFQGFSDLFENYESWLGKILGSRVHGHLYAPDRVEFAGGETVWSGALSDGAILRDYDPAAFLRNLVWNTRGERQCFQFGPADNQAMTRVIAQDANAHVSVISGAWAVPLFRLGAGALDIRLEAARLQKIETAQLAVLRGPEAQARVRTWTLAEFVENPMEPLQSIADEISPRARRSLTEAPHLADLKGFGQFLQTLRNQGMQPVLMGDFPVGDDPAPQVPRRSRPYLVK